jgi:hypothetical protein
MSQPWERDFIDTSYRRSLRLRIKQKAKTAMYALSLVAFCYMAVAKHTINSGKTVK